MIETYGISVINTDFEKITCRYKKCLSQPKPTKHGAPCEDKGTPYPSVVILDG